MPISFYFLLLCVGVSIGLVTLRFWTNRENILRLQDVLESGDAVEKEDQTLVAKNIFFLSLEDIKVFLERNLKIFFHWILHMFVILLGLISDVTDRIYFRARDFFLQTATKEKEVVTAFWHHLKEYKKEKEEENKF
jgi:hypothetical protein